MNKKTKNKALYVSIIISLMATTTGVFAQSKFIDYLYESDSLICTDYLPNHLDISHVIYAPVVSEPVKTQRTIKC